MSQLDLDLGLTRNVIDMALRTNLPRKAIAYVLATGYWETARTMEPVEEGFFLGRRAEAHQKSLRYYPWYGRGLVQLTWERNYVHAGRRLNRDLTTDPNVVMEEDLSVAIIVSGMIEGWFTGRKLSDYIDVNRADYVGARKIINGTDADEEIAAIARKYEAALAREGIGEGPNVDTDRPTLRLGDRGLFVSDLQTVLVDHGFQLGRVDGHFGDRTRAAVVAFQSHNNLAADGVVGPMTWTALQVDPEPMPTRDVTMKDLRAAGSTTIDRADKQDVIATVTAIGANAEQARRAAEGATDFASWAQTFIVDNWAFLAVSLVVLGAVLWFNHGQRAERLRQAVSGENLSK